MLLTYVSLIFPVLGGLYLFFNLEKYNWNALDPSVTRAVGNMCLYFSVGFLLMAAYIGFHFSEFDWRLLPTIVFSTVVVTALGFAFRSWSHEDENDKSEVVNTDIEE